MTRNDIAAIIQSSLILVLFLYIVFKKPPVQNQIDYNRIKKDYEKKMNLINNKIDSIDNINNLIVYKIDSLKNIIPNHKIILNNISSQIDSINENYKNIDYYTVSDSMLLSRLSR
jgi:peptidoglycan hydrolase CwlO-like protein